MNESSFKADRYMLTYLMQIACYQNSDMKMTWGKNSKKCTEW